MPLDTKQTVTVTGVSGTAFTSSLGWIPMNQFESPFNASFGIVKSDGGKITFKVEHTFDNVFDSAVTPVAFTHADVSAATSSTDGNYAFPVRAVRLTTVSASGSATLTFHVLQAGL